jgi:hypothetical protein
VNGETRKWLPKASVASRFSRLILDALIDPADRPLAAASAFFDTLRDGDDERIPFLRRMVYKAMDWCVFEYPE